jgi:hypothetical protein
MQREAIVKGSFNSVLTNGPLCLCFSEKTIARRVTTGANRNLRNDSIVCEMHLLPRSDRYFTACVNGDRQTYKPGVMGLPKAGDQQGTLKVRSSKLTTSPGSIYLHLFTDKWSSVLDLLNRNSFAMNYVNFWGHSDADMLEIGNGGLTVAEERSHFAFWAAMKSPLLIGCDLAKIRQSSLNILKNKYLLAFNQDDTIGEPATPYKWGTNPNWTFDGAHPAEFWSGKFKQGTMVLVLNPANSLTSKNVKWAEVPQLNGSGRYHVTDAWTGTKYGCFSDGLDVLLQPHDTAVLVVTNDCGVPARRDARDFVG